MNPGAVIYLDLHQFLDLWHIIVLSTLKYFLSIKEDNINTALELWSWPYRKTLMNVTVTNINSSVTFWKIVFGRFILFLLSQTMLDTRLRSPRQLGCVANITHIITVCSSAFPKLHKQHCISAIQHTPRVGHITSSLLIVH